MIRWGLACRCASVAVWAGLLSSPATVRAGATSESERLNAFFEEVHEAAVARWPEWQTSLGLKTNNNAWNDRSEARRLREHELRIRNLARLRYEFDEEKLDPTAQLSYRLFERRAERGIEWFPYRHHSYAVHQLGGPHTRIPSFLANRHKIDTEADARAYLARLDGVSGMIDQVIDRLETRAAMGIVPPRFAFPKVRADIDAVLTGAPFDAGGADSTILADFAKKLAKLELPDPERAALRRRAEAALVEVVQPAYRRLATVMTRLETRATDDAGVWKFPDGAGFYRHALRARTTTTLSPQAIHDFGLAEVARLHDEMRAVIERLNFAGDLQDFFAFIRDDPANFYPDTAAGKAAYLADSRALIAEMDGALDGYFALRPKAALEVRRVEAYREKTSAIGFYNRPAVYGDRPGIYYVNLFDMTRMPKSEMAALAYHEAIPGHHMQIAIAQELEGLPKFRRFSGNTAYIEGWALYAERLAKEMGFYREPLSDFGRLSYELWRATRLVVDTGLHEKRWSREQAIAYLDANTAMAHENNRKSVERYIVWPGQATTYKIGMRRILALRARARMRLGDRFDIRAFHTAVLGNGALPLDVLGEVVEAWIEEGGR